MPERDEGLVGDFPSIPKQKRAREKRQALLESGRELFLLNGYEQTTAKDIASHAGVATGTFYRYFADKRQLLMSLLENHLEILMPPEPSWFQQDPEGRLASILENHCEQLNKLGLYKVLPELLPKDSELAEVLAAAKKKVFQTILERLKKAKLSGLIWEDLDPQTVTWAIMVLMENVQEKGNQTGELADFQEIAKVICRLVYPPKVLETLSDQENQK